MEGKPSIYQKPICCQSKKLIKIKTHRGISDRSLVILKLVGFGIFLGPQLNPINALARESSFPIPLATAKASGNKLSGKWGANPINAPAREFSDPIPLESLNVELPLLEIYRRVSFAAAS